MLRLGGPIGDWLLRGFRPPAFASQDTREPTAVAVDWDARHGEGLRASVQGRRVLDYGCGEGRDVVELVRSGAAEVVGAEIQADLRWRAARRAKLAGVGDRCRFVEHPIGPFDVIVSNDAFEHFADPAAVLAEMAELIGTDGSIWIAFGPPWLHPRGGHLFSVFPWAHLIFSEPCLMRWRARFRHDGARRFSEVPGGLNQMTLGRFERLVANSPLRIQRIDTVPIRGLGILKAPLLREFGTSRLQATLVRR